MCGVGGRRSREFSLQVANELLLFSDQPVREISGRGPSLGFFPHVVNELLLVS